MVSPRVSSALTRTRHALQPRHEPIISPWLASLGEALLAEVHSLVHRLGVNSAPEELELGMLLALAEKLWLKIKDLQS